MKTRTWLIGTAGVLLLVLLGFFYFSPTAGWWYLEFQTDQGAEPSSIRIPVSAAKLDRLHDDIVEGKTAENLEYLPDPFPAFNDSGPTKLIYIPQEQILEEYFSPATAFELSQTQGLRINVEQKTALWVVTGRAVHGNSIGPLVQHIFTLTIANDFSGSEPTENSEHWKITDSISQYISD